MPTNEATDNLSLNKIMPEKIINRCDQCKDLDLITTNPKHANTPVHIAYRGVSDDHLYLAYDRKWQEVKFFRPNGLRVYCQKCRQRIY